MRSPLSAGRFPPGLLAQSDAVFETSLRRLCGLFVLMGFAWRILRYGLQFPIWGDEAFVLLNVLDQDFAGLATGPLKCGQVAPLLFLWGELAIYRTLGGSELAVRLLPLVAGLGSVVLFARLAWRIAPPLAATIAIGILSVAYWPVSMSNTVKPYSLDLLASLALLLPAVEWLRQPERHRWLAVLVAIAPVAIFSSYPAVCVAGGISLAFVPSMGSARNWPARTLYVAFNVGLLVSFAVHFGVVASRQLGQEAGRLEAYLHHYWVEGFPPVSPWAFCVWFVKIHTGRMCAYPVGGSGGESTLTALLVLAGIVPLWKDTRGAGLKLLLLAPFGLNFLAALLGKYPYGGCCRLSQHLAPAICLLAGWGLAWLIERKLQQSSQRKALAAVAIAMGIIFGVGSARDICWPYKDLPSYLAREKVRELMKQCPPADRIAVHPSGSNLDPVNAWWLSRYSDRIVSDPTKADWLIVFRPVAPKDPEATYFGQLSIGHLDIERRPDGRRLATRESRPLTHRPAAW